MAQSSPSASANPDQDVSISNFQSAMAQASTSASANSDHDVFINHHGPDTKKTFASYLYRCLRTHQLRVFLDQPELKRGDYFPPQIKNAIRSASVHVAIFSQGYASSSWCLDELVQMWDTNKPIIPVFYNVKPAELRGARCRKRSYAEALEEQATKTDYDVQTLRHGFSKIEEWRNVLRKVADISGFELEACNGDEGELLEKVVFEVLNRVEKRALHRAVAKDATGLDEKVTEFENFLLQRQQSEKPCILGIMGLGGIGKTTLATEFFNRKMSDYSRSCFFPDVKDNVKDKKLIKLQKKLLEMLNVPYEKIKKVTDVPEGKEMIRKHISSFKALLVIDDVDNEDQVDALFPHKSEIHPDSLILITSRNRQVLIKSNVKDESIYTLSGLREKHSLELFCSHSFNESYPCQGFESLVNKFVKACGGLPLSLKVIGALLKGKNKSYWEGQLNKLPRGIKEILQTSYNALEEDEKEIFLDIACFFIGKDRDMVIRILGERFQNLEDRCLVEVGHEKKIKMHDHLRDMGRELAKGSGLPRRLWRWTEEDHVDLLRESSNGQMTAVRGVRIVYGEYGEDDVFYDAHTEIDDGIRMSSLQLLDAEGDLMQRILTKVSYPNLKWLRWTAGYGSPSLPDSLPPSIPTKNLRVLQIEGHGLKTLWKEEWQAPLELRQLEIEAPLSHIPNSIGQLNLLERIVIGYELWDGGVSITELPEEFCLLQSLKVLVLEGWSKMKALPKRFGNLTSLQHIQLECEALKILPESFGNLTNLQHIQLLNCQSLKRLPESFGNLTNLQHIQLLNCQSLKRLPDSFCDLIKLQHLDLQSCYNLTLQRETLGNISTLKYIDITSCEKIKVLPSQVAHQRSLEQLRLRGTNLEEFPSAIGDLSRMEVLEIGGGPLLDTLPSSLCYLKKLKKLRIYGCQELDNLPDSLCELKSLKDLGIYGCKKLKCLPALLGDLGNLNKFKIYGCRELECLPTSIRRLTQLTELSVLQCPLIRKLPLKEEVVRGKSETLNDFQILPGLQKLKVSETGISEVSFAEGVCCNLRSLSIERCNNVVEVGRLPNTLINLSFSSCHNLRRIDQIHGLAKLQYMNIRDCKELEELPSIETLISLSHLDASRCVKLKHIRGLGQLTKLEDLNVESCAELEELEGIQHCICLRKLTASGCVKLKHIGALGQLTKLEDLNVRGCAELEELEGIQHCICLRELNANSCVKLRNIMGLGQLTELEELYIKGCFELEELEGIQHCTSLDTFYAPECPKLHLDAETVDQLRQRCTLFVWRG